MSQDVRHIDLFYDHAKSQASAAALVTALFPDWETQKDTIEFIRFKDGITNTLLKAVNKRPGYSQDYIDRDAVLLRAYGHGTQVLIDRDRECASHSLLASHNLAPPLLARFNNGLLYRYLQGQVCSPADLRRPEVWRAIARRLSQWHATLPISAIQDKPSLKRELSGFGRSSKVANLSTPNIWTVMHRWTTALPTETEAQVQRKTQLQNELQWLADHLGDVPGIDDQKLIFGHCDLLSANVIIQPTVASLTLPTTQSSPQSSVPASPTSTTASDRDAIPLSVAFIDYEYATPCPVAFDIANHFAEWGGFDCDFSVMPTRSQRRNFLSTYLQSYNSYKGRDFEAAELTQLMDEVDRFRGAPGLYWGIWALIQAQISQIDFDYASYAEVRLSEYWAWKESLEGLAPGKEVPLRERRWAQEE